GNPTRDQRRRVRLLRAYWHIFKSAGSAMKSGRQGDQIFRYFVLETLDKLGFFKYLQQPRAYGEILAEFGFSTGEYTQEVFNTLLYDSENVIVHNSGTYVANKDVPIPSLDNILARIDPRLRFATQIAEPLSQVILDRLQDKHIGVAEVFERDDYRVVNMFNEVLDTRIYSAVREACFAYLTIKERRWLRGKKLIEIGCGSGRETAEIWLHLDGETSITAVDPVPGMLELAQSNFMDLLRETDPAHPPVTEKNRPHFKEGSATRLPFDDNSFDASYWAFMLHWTADPKKAISEVVRVVRPGGLIFGSQILKPYVNPYLNLVVRSSRNSYGFFWREDYVKWFAEEGLEIDIATPAGIIRVTNKA
ncbi:MAG: class I SAM-dependent methyltransferase, partial [Anaerolineales bacterium]